jgi:hypothetical protein
MDIAEQEERKKQALKYFDYAENPIKEWIATQLGEDSGVLFDKIADQYDLISVEVDQQYYHVSLSNNPEELFDVVVKLDKEDAKQEGTDNKEDTTNKNTSTNEENTNQDNTPTNTTTNTITCKTAFNIPKERLCNMHKLRRAASVMYDAVYSVYPFVVKTMDKEFQHHLEDVFPYFNEPLMCFEFKKVNKLNILKTQAKNTLMDATNQLGRVEKGLQEKTDKEHRAKLLDIKKKLIALQDESMEKHNKITDDMIREQEHACDEANKVFQTGQKLYIVLEQNKSLDDEIIYKRLPDIGTKFQDPEEDILQAYKKEHGVDE